MKKYTFHIKDETKPILEDFITYKTHDDAENYEERKEINQFLRDGSVINSLYDQTLDLLYAHDSNTDEEKQALRIFNAAYKICWLITSKQASYGDVTSKMYFRRGDYFVRDLSYYVAWSILKVYSEFYEYDERILDTIRNRTSHKDLFTPYRELVRMQDDPCRPICFSTPGVRLIPSRVCLDSFEEGKIDSDMIVQMLRNQLAHSGALDLEDDEEEQDQYEIAPVDDVLENSFSRIRETCNAIKAENDRIAHAMMEMEVNHNKTIEGKDSTISRLRAEVLLLKQQLAEKETKVEVKEVVKKVVVKEENPMTKVLNWDVITDYALSLGNCKDVQAIYTMLNRLSTRNRYFDDSLMKCLEKLEAYICQLQKPVPPNATFNIAKDYVKNQTNNHQKGIVNE